MTSIVLRLPRPQRKPRIDNLGMALLGSWVVCVVLLTSWGGTTYAWSSLVIIALGVAALGLAAGWVVSAKFAADPVIPLRLFRDQSFRLACAISLLLGVAAISYLPTYLRGRHRGRRDHVRAAAHAADERPAQSGDVG